MDNRTERVMIETSRHRIEGLVTLPKEGYRSRLSDHLNRGDLEFIPMTDVSVERLDGTDRQQHQFVAVARAQILLARPVE